MVKRPDVFEGFDPFNRVYPFVFDETEEGIMESIQEYEAFINDYPAERRTPDFTTKCFCAESLSRLVYALVPNCPMMPSEIYLKYKWNKEGLAALVNRLYLGMKQEPKTEYLWQQRQKSLANPTLLKNYSMMLN